MNPVFSLVLIPILTSVWQSCSFTSGTYFCVSKRHLEWIENRSEVKRLRVMFVNDHDGQPLNKKLFDNMTNLEQVSFQNGKFNLEKGAFSDLPKISVAEFAEVSMALEAGTLDSPTLEVITFHQSLKDLPQNVFKKMPKARQAWIMGNSISTIRKDVFTNTNFVLIHLEDNKIEHIEEGAFSGTKRLEYLSLENNKIKEFNSNVHIGSSNLAVLLLNRNQLDKINTDTLSSLTNLQVLNVSTNAITRVEEKCFANFEGLWLLDVSNNNLDQMNENVLPKDGSNITHLFLHNNELTYLSPTFLKMVSNLKEISMAGNPWKCPCQIELTSWINNNNVKDICKNYVASCKEDGQCVYEKSKDLGNGVQKKEPCNPTFWRFIAQSLHSA